MATSPGERLRQVLRQVATQQRLLLSVGMNDLFSIAGAKVPACCSSPWLSAAEGA